MPTLGGSPGILAGQRGSWQWRGEQKRGESDLWTTCPSLVDEQGQDWKITNGTGSEETHGHKAWRLVAALGIMVGDPPRYPSELYRSTNWNHNWFGTGARVTCIVCSGHVQPALLGASGCRVCKWPPLLVPIDHATAATTALAWPALVVAPLFRR